MAALGVRHFFDSMKRMFINIIKVITGTSYIYYLI